jgi:hypothetical protein
MRAEQHEPKRQGAPVSAAAATIKGQCFVPVLWTARTEITVLCAGRARPCAVFLAILAPRSSSVWMRPQFFDNDQKLSGSVGPPRLEMSALGHKRKLCHARVMSALPFKADIRQCGWDVR